MRQRTLFRSPLALAAALLLPLGVTDAVAQDTLDDTAFTAQITPRNGALMALGIDTCEAYLEAEAAARLALDGGLTADGLIDPNVDAPFYDYQGEADPDPLNITDDTDSADEVDYNFHTMLWRSASYTADPGGQCGDTAQDQGCAYGPVAQEACRCLSQVDPDAATVDYRETFQLSDVHSSPCAPGNREVLHFFFRYAGVDTSGAVDEPVIYDSAPSSIIIDMERPTGPTVAPLTVIPSGATLTLSLPSPRSIYAGLSEVQQAEALNDVNDYEICYRLRADGEAPPEPLTASDDSTNVSLRDGFRCVGPVSLTTSYSLTGLQNNAEYWVTYAVRDGAGNRSPNAPVALGTPVGGAAFSDIYEFQGGGEEGGCQAAWGRGPAGGAAALSALCLLALAGLRRRR